MKEIDIEKWNRKEHFEFFSKMASPYFGIITELYDTNTLNLDFAYKIGLINEKKMAHLSYINNKTQKLDIDYDPDNKDIVKRCEGFQKLTYDTFKTTLYNEGKNIKKSLKIT
jgi:hypothetical protein